MMRMKEIKAAATLLTRLLKGRARNKLRNYGAEILSLVERYQEAHSSPTQRLRSFKQRQKSKPECATYFMPVPKLTPYFLKEKRQYDT